MGNLYAHEILKENFIESVREMFEEFKAKEDFEHGEKGIKFSNGAEIKISIDVVYSFPTATTRYIYEEKNIAEQYSFALGREKYQEVFNSVIQNTFCITFIARHL